MNLSTGTQNKSLVHDASKETRPEGARQSGGMSLCGTHEGRRSGMPVPMQPTPLCEDASTGNIQVSLERSTCRSRLKEKPEKPERVWFCSPSKGFSRLEADDAKTYHPLLHSGAQPVTESQPATQETALPALPNHPSGPRRHQGHQALEADATPCRRFVGQGTSPASQDSWVQECSERTSLDTWRNETPSLKIEGGSSSSN